MGCYPLLGKIVSKALGRCSGRDRWREERMDDANAYPSGPPTETHYTRPWARTVTFSGNNSVYVIPPEPQGPQQQQGPEPQRQSQTPPPQHEPDHHPPQPQPEPPAAAPAPAQSAPPAEPKQPKRGRNKQPGRVRFGPDPPPPQQQQHAPSPNDDSYAPGHGHGAAPAPQPQGYFRYTPSPLPRWEATPRRHEYFSGEYRYSYPTPVREGIYSIATDANRLTTIFSEENPNACAIVWDQSSRLEFKAIALRELLGRPLRGIKSGIQEVIVHNDSTRLNSDLVSTRAIPSVNRYSTSKIVPAPSLPTSLPAQPGTMP